MFTLPLTAQQVTLLLEPAHWTDDLIGGPMGSSFALLLEAFYQAEETPFIQTQRNTPEAAGGAVSCHCHSVQLSLR